MPETCKCPLSVHELELHFAFYVYALVHPNCFRRYNSEQLTRTLCVYIDDFKGPREILYRSCERLIVRIVETHRMYFCLNRSQPCYKKMIHEPLYAVARIAFYCGFPNSKVVVRLLSEIYRCDRGMRKIFMGAYMNPKDCVGYWGKHPIFGSQKEGHDALRYFLEHGNKAKKVFYDDGVPSRMADVSLRVPSFQHPAVYAVARGSYSTFKLLMEFGTNLFERNVGCSRCNASWECTTSNVPCSCRASNPRRLDPVIEDWVMDSRPSRMRYALPTFSVEEDNYVEFRNLILLEHFIISGQDIPCLMQFCRRVIRRRLYDNFLLPCGIKSLPIPPLLKKYINLDFD